MTSQSPNSTEPDSVTEPEETKQPEAWQPVGVVPADTVVKALYVDPDEHLHAVWSRLDGSYPEIHRFDGEKWVLVGGVSYSEKAHEVSSLTTKEALYLRFSYHGIARHVWQNKSWEMLGGELPEGARVFGLAVSSQEKVYAIGRLKPQPVVYADGLFEFKDSGWVQVDLPQEMKAGHGIAFDSNDDLVVLGSSNASDLGHAEARVLYRRSGDAWEFLQKLDPSATSVVPTLVNPGDGRVYVLGDFIKEDSQTQEHRVLRWDEPSRRLQRIAVASGRIRNMAAGSSGDLYICGDFSLVDGVVTGGIARWDGSVWRKMPGHMRALSAVVVDGAGTVFAGGHDSLVTEAGSFTIARFG